MSRKLKSGCSLFLPETNGVGNSFRARCLVGDLALNYSIDARGTEESNASLFPLNTKSPVCFKYVSLCWLHVILLPIELRSCLIHLSKACSSSGEEARTGFINTKGWPQTPSRFSKKEAYGKFHEYLLLPYSLILFFFFIRWEHDMTCDWKIKIFPNLQCDRKRNFESSDVH